MLRGSSPFLRFALAVSENRLEWNQTQSSGHSQGLHSVVHLKLIVDVCKMKIYGSL